MTTVSLVPRGRTFVRGVIAHTMASANPDSYAANRWGHSHAQTIAKAAVPAIIAEPGGTPEAREFFGMAIEQSLLGRVPNLRRIGFNIPNLRQTTGARGYWVSEARPIPLSTAAMDRFTLLPLTVASIIVATKEAVMSMGEVQEAALQRDLLNAIAGAVDLAFIDPDNAGTPDQAPASITNAATQFPSTGIIRQDMRNLFDQYQGSMLTACIVMHPRTAVAIGVAASQLGETKLTVRCGVRMGVPVVCSEAVPFDSNGGSVTIFDAAAVAYAARDFDLSMSDEATLQMSDSPTFGSGDFVSLFQTNALAWRSTASANWEVNGTGNVVTMYSVSYGLSQAYE